MARAELRRALARVRREERGIVRILSADFPQHRLDLRVRRELARLLLQDQIGPHAASGERPYAVVVLRAIRVRVEVARALVAGLLEQLDDEEQRLDRLGSKSQILIEAAELL